MKRKLSTILVLVLMLSTIFSANIFASTKTTVKNSTYTVQSKLDGKYEQKAKKFIKDSRWKNGIKWTYSQGPKLSTYSASGYCAYAVDFCKYVFNKNSYRLGKKFTKVNEIKAGDVIHVKNKTHWFVVLERNGNKLKTAEGNWQGKVVVSNSTYTIKNNKIYRNGRYFRAMDAGYHMK